MCAVLFSQWCSSLCCEKVRCSLNNYVSCKIVENSDVKIRCDQIVFSKQSFAFSPIAGKSATQEISANPHRRHRGHEALEPVQGQSSYDV